MTIVKLLLILKDWVLYEWYFSIKDKKNFLLIYLKLNHMIYSQCHDFKANINTICSPLI